jgi:exodeoxyribonuclease VII large subunit
MMAPSMTDISTETSRNLPEYSVSELSQALKRTVENAYSYVRVRGEVSGFKRAASGHLYMSLKDESANLDAVCWRGVAGRLAIKPEDGLEVIASGKLTTYPGRSKYQIVIDSLELAGEGALLKMLEDRRKALAAEGLFDQTHKQAIPYLPDVVGVVTSLTGAVIRDILHRLNDRFPRHVLLAPVLVQGEGAAAQVAAAIAGFNAFDPTDKVPRPDVLIVARGGGSLEDLWAFNEEIVVRAAAASDIPLISAVGHETDTTLIDLVADRRAPTPSAAAEMAVPVRAELVETIIDAARRMVGGMSRMLEERRLRVEGLVRGLPDVTGLIGVQVQRLDVSTERLDNAGNGITNQRAQAVALLNARLKNPAQLLDEAAQKVGAEARALGMAMMQRLGRHRERHDGAVQRLSPAPLRRSLETADVSVRGLAPRLEQSIQRWLTDGAQRLAHLSELLDSYSSEHVLARGYAIVRDANDTPVTSTNRLRPGDAIELQFANKEKADAVITGSRSKRAARPTENKQGELL